LSPNTTTFRAIASRYRREVFPRKAPQTQRDNETELKNLEAVFGDVPTDKIKPHHVRRYLDTRGLKAKVRANREKALLSHVFNCAREWATPMHRTHVPESKDTGRPAAIATSKTVSFGQSTSVPISQCKTQWTLRT
jgi:hypothetical protein